MLFFLNNGIFDFFIIFKFILYRVVIIKIFVSKFLIFNFIWISFVIVFVIVFVISVIINVKYGFIFKVNNFVEIVVFKGKVLLIVIFGKFNILKDI